MQKAYRFMGLVAAVAFLAVFFIIQRNLLSGTVLDPGLRAGGGKILALQLDVNRSDCLQAGEQVQIRLTVTNPTRKLLSIKTQNLPVVDLTVEDHYSHRVLQSWAQQNPDKARSPSTWLPVRAKCTKWYGSFLTLSIILAL